MGLPAPKEPAPPTAESPDDERTICFCHNRCCREIKEAIRAGAHTLKDVQDETQASTGCGGCEYEVREILEQEGYPQD
jgi:nitrite reductase (NADH) large subunit